jgi:hypothetical protein
MLFICAAFANAQSLDAYFGMGTAHDGSNDQLLDLLGTGNPAPTTAMGGVFGVLGAGLMLSPSIGIGGQVSFRFAQGDYAGLGYRPVLYDFNGIWTPTLGQKRVVPELQAGLGGVSLRFYGGTEYCNPYTGLCSNYAGSLNHFQLHAGFGVRFFVNEHIFVRPQFDYHWVRNLTDQFKSNSVPAYSIAIGFSTR